MDRHNALLAAVVALISTRACAQQSEDGTLPLITDTEVAEALRVVVACDGAVSSHLTAGLPVIATG